MKGARHHSEIGWCRAPFLLWPVSHFSPSLPWENDTGTELVARAIHKASNRSEHPFIALNCVAIPKDLLPSELFGYWDPKRKIIFSLKHPSNGKQKIV